MTRQTEGIGALHEDEKKDKEKRERQKWLVGFGSCQRVNDLILKEMPE